MYHVYDAYALVMKYLLSSVLSYFLLCQDLEVTGDKDDSRSLHVTIHKRSMVSPHAKSTPILNARFQFDDHIRCMAAKQRLTKGIPYFTFSVTSSNNLACKGILV